MAAPTVAAGPIPQTPPEPTVLPTPVIASAPEEPLPEKGRSAWFWALIGGGAIGLVGFAAWLRLRRKFSEDGRDEAMPVAVAAVPSPPLSGPNPTQITPLASPVLDAAEPFEIALTPKRVHVGEREILLELELSIGNAGTRSAEAVRLSVGAISASPEQDAQLAGFHATSQLLASAAPFDLAPGAGARMPISVNLPRDAVHVVDLGGRPMFVPIVAIGLRWRSGLSIRHFTVNFMLGTAAQGCKLGPIWLDRGQPRAALAANRYSARIAAGA